MNQSEREPSSIISSFMMTKHRPKVSKRILKLQILGVNPLRHDHICYPAVFSVVPGPIGNAKTSVYGIDLPLISSVRCLSISIKYEMLAIVMTTGS